MEIWFKWLRLNEVVWKVFKDSYLSEILFFSVWWRNFLMDILIRNKFDSFISSLSLSFPFSLYLQLFCPPYFSFDCFLIIIYSFPLLILISFSSFIFKKTLFILEKIFFFIFLIIFSSVFFVVSFVVSFLNWTTQQQQQKKLSSSSSHSCLLNAVFRSKED